MTDPTDQFQFPWIRKKFGPTEFYFFLISNDRLARHKSAMQGTNWPWPSKTAFAFIWLGNAIILWIKIFFSECVKRSSPSVNISKVSSPKPAIRVGNGIDSRLQYSHDNWAIMLPLCWDSVQSELVCTKTSTPSYNLHSCKVIGVPS